MTITAEATKKFRDTANFNNVVEITYTNDAAGEKVTERLQSVDLTDAMVAEQARKRIKNVFEPGDAALAALTLGPIELPADPVISLKEQDVINANKVFRDKLSDAQIKALNDPEVAAAYAAMKAARAALEG